MRPVVASHILTVEDVAARWKVTPAVVADMCRRGELVAFKAGRQWRITTAAVHQHEHGEVAA